MAVKLYVGNLPFSATEEDLRELFSEYGTVESVSVIKDHNTGRPRGFGFVELADDAQAKAAVEALNGKDFNERALVVNEARPREERSDRPKRDFNDRGGSFRQRSW